MNYTETVRNFINDKKGELFDITYELEAHFNMIEAKTLMRILNRLEDEGLVSKVAKGLYFINDDTGYSKEKLIKYFTSEYRGVIVGYPMYNELGITTFKSDEATIYTNAIGTFTRNVGNIHLIQFKDYFILQDEANIIKAMDILEKGYNNIIDVDAMAAINTIQKLLMSYTDDQFKEVASKIKYKATTIEALSTILKVIFKPNKCKEIFYALKHE